MINFNNTPVPRAIIDIDITTFAELVSTIENSNDGDVLNLNIRNDLLFTSTVVIRRSLTINITNGSGENEVILSTIDNNLRHFSTNPSGAASLADVLNLSMTINEGVVLNGNNTSGGIGFFSSDGQLVLNGCSIINCARSGSGDAGNGGALWVSGNTSICMLTMRDTLIENCTANNGGGIHMNGNTICIMSNGEISGNLASAASSNGGGVYVFGATNSFTMNGGTISNNMATNGGGVFLLNGDFTMSGDARIIDNSGSNSAGNAGNGGGVYNISGHYNRNPIDDELYFTHIFGTRWTSPFIQGYNNFDISYTNGTPFIFPADVTLQGSKNAIGAPLPGGFFDFGVFDESGNLVVTATADADGNINFPVITFTEPGTFNYTIREITLGGDGWTTDTSVFRVTITVIDNGEGRLDVAVDYPDGFPSFTNTFQQPEPEPVIVTIRATKCVRGACLCAGCFVFGLCDQNCNEVARVSNDSNGNIVFPELTFTEPGEHCYTIRELSCSNRCWITDTRCFTVFITITENSARQLMANVNYPNGQPVFVNCFCPR